MGEPIVELIGSLILLSFFNVPEAWLGIIRANVPVDVVIPVFSAEFESYLPMINTYLGLAVVLASVMLYYRYRVAGILIAELALALFGIGWALFGSWAGLVAAATFAAAGPTIYQSQWATFDAMMLTVVLLACWLGVVSARRTALTWSPLVAAVGRSLRSCRRARRGPR